MNFFGLNVKKKEKKEPMRLHFILFLPLFTQVAIADHTIPKTTAVHVGDKVVYRVWNDPKVRKMVWVVKEVDGIEKNKYHVVLDQYGYTDRGEIVADFTDLGFGQSVETDAVVLSGCRHIESRTVNQQVFKVCRETENDSEVGQYFTYTSRVPLSMVGMNIPSGKDMSYEILEYIPFKAFRSSRTRQTRQ
jgi:hypothetical protein